MHTIKDCNYCGDDYMFHYLDYHLCEEICSVCADKHLVCEDKQSLDSMCTVLAYDYKKHNMSLPILFFGTKEQTDLFKMKVNMQYPDPT